MISGPLVSVPTRTQTHRPGWAGVQPAAGTQRAHSAVAGLRGRRARQVWGCREESPGFHRSAKVPPAGGMVPAAGWEEGAGWWATQRVLTPLRKHGVCTNLQRQMRETEAWRGWWEEGQARPRILARQGLGRCGRLLVWEGKGRAVEKGPRATGQGCSQGLGSGQDLGSGGDGG